MKKGNKKVLYVIIAIIVLALIGTGIYFITSSKTKSGNNDKQIVADVTDAPADKTTDAPADNPTDVPADPTGVPADSTETPEEPTEEPAAVTEEPTQVPTAEPTQAPTAEPTQAPTATPTPKPTATPTPKPTATPTPKPTATPTPKPTATPTPKPTATPAPTEVPADDTKFVIPQDNKTFDIDFAKTLFGLNRAFQEGPIAEKMYEHGISLEGTGNGEPKAGDHTSFYAIGQKTGYYGGKSRQVVVIVVHGTLNNEWASNIDFAPSHDNDTQYAENFYLASEDIYNKVKGMLSKDKIIVVTGYSRGAAVANLLAFKLNGLYGSDNIYCYTFATPATVRADLTGDTGNIFNVLNANDIVPAVPPAFLGYKRLGTDIVLGTKNSTTQSMESTFAKFATSIPDISTYYTVKYSTTKAGPVDNGKTFYEFLSEYVGLIGGGEEVNYTSLILGLLSIRSSSPFAPFKSLVTINNISAIKENHEPDAYSELLNSYVG